MTRPIDYAKREQIAKMIKDGASVREISTTLHCSHQTIENVKKELAAPVVENKSPIQLDEANNILKMLRKYVSTKKRWEDPNNKEEDKLSAMAAIATMENVIAKLRSGTIIQEQTQPVEKLVESVPDEKAELLRLRAQIAEIAVNKSKAPVTVPASLPATISVPPPPPTHLCPPPKGMNTPQDNFRAVLNELEGMFKNGVPHLAHTEQIKRSPLRVKVLGESK